MHVKRELLQSKRQLLEQWRSFQQNLVIACCQVLTRNLPSVHLLHPGPSPTPQWQGGGQKVCQLYSMGPLRANTCPEVSRKEPSLRILALALWIGQPGWPLSGGKGKSLERRVSMQHDAAQCNMMQHACDCLWCIAASGLTSFPRCFKQPCNRIWRHWPTKRKIKHI